MQSEITREKFLLSLPSDWLAKVREIAEREGAEVSEQIRALMLHGMKSADRKGLSPNPSRGAGGGRPRAET